MAGALGNAADAVAVRDGAAAVDALEHLKTADLGRAGLLLGGAPRRGAATGRACPQGRRTPSTWSTPRPSSTGALARLLFKVAVVADLDSARRLVAELPDVTAVTRDGDVLGTHFAHGGSSSQPSLIEVQAALDEAVAALAEAVASAERLAFETSRVEAERLDAQKRADVALARLHESDATLAAVAEELGHYGSQARAARAEAARVTDAITAAEEARDRDLAGLAELEQRLTTAEDAPDEEPDTTRREELVEAARASRQIGDGGPPRAAHLRGAGPGPARSRRPARPQRRRREREARAKAAERRERLIREGRAAEAVLAASRVVLAALDRSVDRATAARAEVEQARSGREEELLAVRAALRDLAREHDELVNSVHRDEMARTQQKMRIEQLEERALEELGLEPDGLRRRLRPRAARAVHRHAGRGGGRAGADGVRPRGAAEAAAGGRA